MGDPLFTPLRVCVAGNIGAGKTTLATSLAEHLGYVLCEEPNELNEYLADFYKNPRKYALPCQVAFLADRFSQHTRIMSTLHDGDGAVLDRGPHEDKVFADLQHTRGDMDDRDYRTYLKLFDTLIGSLGPNIPDAVIYLRVPPETLVKRIASRGRSMETSVSIQYLMQLHEQYEKFVIQMGEKTAVYCVDWSDFEATDLLWKEVERLHTGKKGVVEVVL